MGADITLTHIGQQPPNTVDLDVGGLQQRSAGRGALVTQMRGAGTNITDAQTAAPTCIALPVFFCEGDRLVQWFSMAVLMLVTLTPHTVSALARKSSRSGRILLSSPVASSCLKLSTVAVSWLSAHELGSRPCRGEQTCQRGHDQTPFGCMSRSDTYNVLVLQYYVFAEEANVAVAAGELRLV